MAASAVTFQFHRATATGHQLSVLETESVAGQLGQHQRGTTADMLTDRRNLSIDREVTKNEKAARTVARNSILPFPVDMYFA